MKEGRPNVVDLIKGERIHLIVNTPHGIDPWFDEKAIRRAAVTARIPTITTLSAARAACDGIAALQRGDLRCTRCSNCTPSAPPRQSRVVLALRPACQSSTFASPCGL